MFLHASDLQLEHQKNLLNEEKAPDRRRRSSKASDLDVGGEDRRRRRIVEGAGSSFRDILLLLVEQNPRSFKFQKHREWILQSDESGIKF